MATNAVNKIKLGYSPLTKRIILYRHGKDERVALDKRDAEKDVMAVVTEMMMDGTPNGAVKEYSFGDQQYEITVKPIKK